MVDMDTTQYRKERLAVMVSEAEKNQIHQEASQAGVGVGEYVRRRLLGSKSLDIEKRFEALEDRVQSLESLVQHQQTPNRV